MQVVGLLYCFLQGLTIQVAGYLLFSLRTYQTRRGKDYCQNWKLLFLHAVSFSQCQSLILKLV